MKIVAAFVVDGGGGVRVLLTLLGVPLKPVPTSNRQVLIQWVHPTSAFPRRNRVQKYPKSPAETQHHQHLHREQRKLHTRRHSAIDRRTSGMTLSASLASVFPARRRMNLLATTCAPGIISGAKGANVRAVAAISRGRRLGMALMSAIGSRPGFRLPYWICGGGRDV